MSDDSDDKQEWLDDEQREQLRQQAGKLKESLQSVAGRVGDSASNHGGDLRSWLLSTRGQLVVVAAVAALIAVAVVGFAFVGYGTLAGILAAVGLIAGIAAPWTYVRVMFAPVGGGVLAVGWFILAQLTYGQGALVEKSSGGYEWRRLQDDSSGLFCELSNGERVDIDGEVADLPTVAWAPLAVVSQKQRSNMDRFTVSDSWSDTRPDPTDTDSSVATPKLEAVTDGGAWHLDSSKLEDWARGTGSNELPRNGRRMALEEAGGEQAVSQLFVLVASAILAVVGFVLAAGTLILTG